MGMIFAPQPGPQEQFLASSADICVYGGAAGGGKTYAELLEPLRHIDNPKFNVLILRHAYTQITAPGGLWDSAREIYPYIKGAVSGKTPKLHWNFKSGASITFAHLTRNEDCEQWQGSQICLIEFDELCHFTEYQFFYMFSRNRSVCGVKPYIRATCNPDADSWVARFISWWIDRDTGYPIKERAGVIRWMVRLKGVIHWFDNKEDAIGYARDDGVEEDQLPFVAKSVTFIPSSVQDNKELLKSNPQYMTNLLNLPMVERERLLNGNWKIKNHAGLMFQRGQVKVVPKNLINRQNIISLCRGWDLAATAEDEKGDPAYTAGVLMAMMKDGQYAILDVINMRLSAGQVLSLIKNTAASDKAAYGYVKTRLPQDPGQAGKSQAAYYISQLAGYDAVARPETGDKTFRATPVAAQWQHGFFTVAEGDWNDDYFSQLEGFPESKFKDMVDATSSAFDELTNYGMFNIDSML